MEKKKPEFINVYYCPECDMDFSYVDDDQPYCRVCDKETNMTFVEKIKITPQVIADRIKASTDRMYNALRAAYDARGEDFDAAYPDTEDPEKMMLNLLAKAKKFKEKIDNLELKDGENVADKKDE